MSSRCARARPSISSASSCAPPVPSSAASPSPSRTSSTTWYRSPNSDGESAPGLPLRLGRPRDRERAPDRGLEQPPRLQRVPSGEIALAALDVVVLPADHPERRPGELARDLRPWIRERELERLREERVAVEDRGRLVELHVRGRPPAAHVVVVERGQVVVDHPERVHELDGGRCRQELVRARARAPRRPRGRARDGPACRRRRGCSASRRSSAPSSSANGSPAR